MNLNTILNKTLQRAHMKSEFDVLGVPRKLVKYVVYLSKRKKEKKKKRKKDSSHKLPKLQSTSF
jgi:hypothetical protein